MVKPWLRLCASVLCVAVAAGACGSTSAPVAEPADVEEPPTFGEPTPEPTAAPAPTSTPQPEAVAAPAVSDEQRIEAAIAYLVAQGPTAQDSHLGEMLDAGVLRDGITVEDGVVSLQACPWFDGSTQSRVRNYDLGVSDSLEVFPQPPLPLGDDCVSDALIQSATAFAIEFYGVFAEMLGPDGDPEDPRVEQYWTESRVDDTYQGLAHERAGFREVWYFPDLSAGVPVAYAHHQASHEFIIAVRFEYDDRYAWYDNRTGERLWHRSSQKAPDELVGDDQVVQFVLHWLDGRWWYFTSEDLYAIDCTTPDCVETLHSLGTPPGRRINRAVDFTKLTYTGIAQ